MAYGHCNLPLFLQFPNNLSQLLQLLFNLLQITFDGRDIIATGSTFRASAKRYQGNLAFFPDADYLGLLCVLGGG